MYPVTITAILTTMAMAASSNTLSNFVDMSTAMTHSPFHADISQTSTTHLVLLHHQFGLE